MPVLETRVPIYEGAQELLLGILLQTLLTGAYLVIAAECARTLCQRRQPRSGRSWYLAATWFTLLVLIVTKSIVDMQMTIRSWSRERSPGKPSSLAEIVLTNLLLVLITVCADIFLTYRVYIVWNFRWPVIIVPCLLCAGEIGTGVYAVYAVFVSGISTIPTHAMIQNITKGWAIYFYFALTANLLCTGLIAGRIWWVRRLIKDDRFPANDSVKLFVTLVVESAAVYTAIFIPEIICMQWELPQRYVFLNIIGPIVGIVFSYIIIRAARNQEINDTTVASTHLGFARGTVSHATLSGYDPGAQVHILTTLSRTTPETISKGTSGEPPQRPAVVFPS